MSAICQTHNAAPIAFFTYIRPEHTRLALESLKENHGAESSELYIYCDGPKSASENILINQVREIVKSKKWCGTVHVIERETNMGLANSVIAGVTDLCEKFGRVIVIEDDLILSPYFLDYMNSALDLYQEDNQVMQVSGHMFPVKLSCVEDTFFLPFTTSWGWATWNRAWQYLDSDVKQFSELASDPKRVNEFNLDGSYPYFSMLKDQLDGKIDSWAIRWYFSVFIMNGLILYTKWSLVNNIGFDGSGTHCNKSKVLRQKFRKKAPNITVPSVVSVCNSSFQHIRKFLSAKSKPVSFSFKNILISIKKRCSDKLRSNKLCK